jgi:hypothetical protein
MNYSDKRNKRTNKPSTVYYRQHVVHSIRQHIYSGLGNELNSFSQP